MLISQFNSIILLLFPVSGASPENVEDPLFKRGEEGIRKLSQESKFFQWNKSDASAGAGEEPDTVHQRGRLPVQGEIFLHGHQIFLFPNTQIHNNTQQALVYPGI